MAQIEQRPDQTDEQFYAEVDPYDDRLSAELPRWSCFASLAVLIGIVSAAYWLLT